MDTVDPTRFLTAFVFVIALIGLLAAVLRYIGKRKFGIGSGTISQGESGRLRVIETRYVDGRRRLVLVRRDNKEHLLLLSPDRETVLESYPVAKDPLTKDKAE